MFENDSLEDANIINMIRFYKSELMSIIKGSSVDEVFNASEKRKLRDKGILGYTYPYWVIPKRVKEILSQI